MHICPDEMLLALGIIGTLGLRLRWACARCRSIIVTVWGRRR